MLQHRAQASPADDMTGVHSRALTQACYGLPFGSRWSESIKPCILPAPVAAGLAICAMRNAPLIGQQTLVDYARGCQSTTHRPLNCRCACKRAHTEHGSDAADMPGQYEVSRAPRLHTAHIRFSGPSNVHEICPRWTRRRLSWPEPDATRPRSRGLGRASTSPPRAAVAVAVIGRAVVAPHVRRTAATTSHEVPIFLPQIHKRPDFSPLCTPSCVTGRVEELRVAQ